MESVNLKKNLIEKRVISYNDFAGSLRLIKKKILDIETRLTKESDSINFSVNSDLLEDATLLWKASHRLYQIDDLLTMLSNDPQKSSAPPQNAPETHDASKCVEPPDQKA